MTAHVQMQWGPIYFSQTKASFNAMKKTTEYNWGTVNRLGKDRRPAKQFIGQGENKITLQGVIMPTYSADGRNYVGTKQLLPIEDEAAAGAIHILMDGRGDVYGKFVLVNIDEDRASIMDTGGFMVQSYTLKFERYGED